MIIMPKLKDILVGSMEDPFGNSKEKNCEECGKKCFFNDNWNFEKYKIICSDCFSEETKSGKKIKIKITPETLSKVNKLISENMDANAIIEMLEKYAS